jgi:hypothetical protein
VQIGKLAVACALSLAAVYALSISAKDAHKTDRGWTLTQESKLAGANSILLSKSGFKLEAPKAHYTILMRPPAWNVIFYSDKSRAMYETDARHWQGDVALTASLITTGRFSAMVPDKSKKETFMDLSASHIFLKDPSGKPQSPDGASNEIRDTAYSADYWVTQTFSTPPAVAQVMTKLYRLPLVDNGIPLKLSFLNEHGHKKTEVDTRSCTETQIDASAFAPPKNYQRVKSEKEVLLLDPVKRGVLDDLLN